MKQTSVRTHRKFDQTFKREAVLSWLHSGNSATVVGQELGLTANLLYAWRGLAPEAAPAGRGEAKARRPSSRQKQICAPAVLQFKKFIDHNTCYLL